jgi:hypothetical protein
MMPVKDYVAEVNRTIRWNKVHKIAHEEYSRLRKDYKKDADLVRVLMMKIHEDFHKKT